MWVLGSRGRSSELYLGMAEPNGTNSKATPERREMEGHMAAQRRHIDGTPHSIRVA